MEQAAVARPGRPMSVPRAIPAFFLILLAACGPSPSGPVSAAGTPLPPYTAADFALLDDRFSPEVFGAVVDAADPVRQRASLADGIVRARIVTVTRDSNGQREAFVVELTPVPPSLKGPNVSERLALSIPIENPSFAFVKSFEAELVGRPVIVIYKRFAEGGQATMRWHIEAENPRVLAAIDRARLMGELGR